jgi:hypothetical protein
MALIWAMSVANAGSMAGWGSRPQAARSSSPKVVAAKDLFMWNNSK